MVPAATGLHVLARGSNNAKGAALDLSYEASEGQTHIVRFRTERIRAYKLFTAVKLLCERTLP